METQKYFTLQEVADRLRVCDKTVWRWVKANKIEACKLEGQWRFEESEIRRFITAGKRARDRQVPRIKRTYTKRKTA